MDRRIRILIGKPGLDGHDRGAKYIARALRDAGMEVIYTGIRQTPEAIANAAIQEDVDFVGLSLLSGAHNYLFPEVARLLKEKGAADIILFGGGVIPEEDIPVLKKAGFKAVFTPGASATEVIDFIQNEFQSG
ncbi:MAG: cobalamin B12-binding domain-containing protein [Candidatus Fermentibacteraceae bacterium]|nr:cobalamin B12-binding domain-containing protein [Candidatus Fermentibacteraceae bacterium]